MRDMTPRPHVDYFWWTFWVLVGAFVLQNVLGVWFRLSGPLYDWFALSPANMAQGKVWTIFTYSLLHGGIGHFFMNAIGLFFIGRWLSREIAPRSYLQLIIASMFLGGLVWLSIHALLSPVKAAPLIGFSAVVIGMLVTTCLIWPHGKITLLLFFVIPLEFRPRTLMWIVIGLDAAGFLFIELPSMLGMAPVMRDGGVGFSAHLGGALAGYLFYRYMQRPGPIFKSTRKSVSIEPPQWMKKKSPTTTGKFKVNTNTNNRRDLRKEVDRILDKINKEGFGALNEEEKRILDQAGELLKK